MRSRSRLELAGLTLGAAAEGVWAGALAAALTAASGTALIAFACGVVLIAALLARRLASGDVRERAARILALALILVAAGLLLAAGRAWTHPSPWWQIVCDVVYAAGLVLLGAHLGRASQPPEAAVGRAVRAFALLCAVLVCAALGGSAPPWAPAAIVASLAVGGLLVAVVRHRDLTDLVVPSERLPAWPWLLAVLGAVLGVVAVGALLSQVLRVGVVLGGLDYLGGLLRYALDGLAYVVGYAGSGLLRGIAWLLDLVHVHARDPADVPQLAQRPPALPERDAQNAGLPGALRLIAMLVGSVAAIGVSLALVALALRRFRRDLPAEVLVVEEREALASLRSAAGVFAARLGRRLRRRLLPPRLHEPRPPAELVRRRYAELERRLSRAGQPRLSGVTVRDHLAAVAAAPSEAAPPLSSLAAADLAAIYELARYSAHTIDATQARRFEALARAFNA